HPHSTLIEDSFVVFLFNGESRHFHFTKHRCLLTGCVDILSVFLKLKNTNMLVSAHTYSQLISKPWIGIQWIFSFTLRICIINLARGEDNFVVYLDVYESPNYCEFPAQHVEFCQRVHCCRTLTHVTERSQ